MADKYTIGFDYDTETQVLGTGDNYVTFSGTTEQLTSAVDMNDWEGCIFRVEVNFDSTPTDNVDVTSYHSIDGTTYDTVGNSEGQIDNANDPSARHYAYYGDGGRYLKIGVTQDGSTDSHDVRIYATKFRRVSADA